MQIKFSQKQSGLIILFYLESLIIFTRYRPDRIFGHAQVSILDSVLALFSSSRSTYFILASGDNNLSEMCDTDELLQREDENRKLGDSRRSSLMHSFPRMHSRACNR